MDYLLLALLFKYNNIICTSEEKQIYYLYMVKL